MIPSVRRIALVAALFILAGCGGDSTSPTPNRPPVISRVRVSPGSTTPGGIVRAVGLANDPDGDAMSVSWAASAGSLDDPLDFTTNWIAPDTAGTYTLIFTVSDGSFTTSDSVQVPVGSGTLIVVSDPPGANVFVDDNPLVNVTPVTLESVAPGTHDVRVEHLYFDFNDNSTQAEVQDGMTATASFSTDPARVQTLDPGRSDLLELGGVAFLRNGFGYLVAGRTAEGTGVFSAALNPLAGNGRRLVTGVDLNEPLAVSADGDRLVYTDDTGGMISVRLVDQDANGLVERAEDPHRLDPLPQYGAALSDDDRLAFSVTASPADPEQPVFWSFFTGTALDPWQIASSRLGKLPTWEPQSERLAFAAGGVLFETLASAASTDTLSQRTGAWLSRPAWGPWGNNHLALLSGVQESALTDVLLATRSSDAEATLLGGLTDPRFLSWSRVQRALLVTHNPGSGVLLLLSDLPLP